MYKDYNKILKKYFFTSRKTIKFFENQIDSFYEIFELNCLDKKYLIDDEVILDKNYLIKGIVYDYERIESIKNNGFLAPEFFSDSYDTNQKKPFCSEFWIIKEKIKLKDYVYMISGATIRIRDKDDNVIDHIVCPLNELQETIKKIANYDNIKDWKCCPTKESKFLPNYIIKNNILKIAFILNCQNKKVTEYINTAIQYDYISIKVKKKILPKWYYKKYCIGYKDGYETDRELAIPFGVPSNLIEGIIVDRKCEKDKKIIRQIQNVFPNCYICNVDGIVIYNCNRDDLQI